QFSATMQSSVRVMDNVINVPVTLITGYPSNSTYIRFPQDPRNTLGCTKAILILVVKLLKKDFSFECQVLDDKGLSRRFEISNFTEMADNILVLDIYKGWQVICFDMVGINANCRLRDVFFDEYRDGSHLLSYLHLPVRFSSDLS
uniref:CFA20 domain-containing protein n=1 Tax=Denticeps clupeoides TaxID=299321 RepID=A0AAY4AV36_9TELE